MNRREWMAGLGALGLGTLVPRHVFAAETLGPPTRLVLFWTPNGTVMDAFWPSDGGFGEILAPLEGRAAQVVPIRGLDMVVATQEPVAPDHLPDIRAALSGRRAEPSGERWVCAGETVDQYLARRLGGTRLPSLELAVQPLDRLCYRSRDTPVQPLVDPRAAFERLFADQLLDEAAAARLRAERRSILDTVTAELGDLQGVLGKDERRVLEQHLESVREVEVALDAPDPNAAACDPTPPPGVASVLDPLAFPEVGRQMLDVIALAFACDATRLATLQWSGAASPVVHSWAGVSSAHHSTAHQLGLTAGEARTRLLAIERWYATQFAYLLDRLAAVDLGSGTLLDHTHAVWLHEQSDGAAHSRLDMPVVWAGKVSGNRRLDYGGVPHNRMLVSFCHAMGLSDVTHFGDPDQDGTPLEDLL